MPKDIYCNICENECGIVCQAAPKGRWVVEKGFPTLYDSGINQCPTKKHKGLKPTGISNDGSMGAGLIEA